MQRWFYAHETRQKTIKNALFHARLLILPENMYFYKNGFALPSGGKRKQKMIKKLIISAISVPRVFIYFGHI
jgi:hypothetical protein